MNHQQSVYDHAVLMINENVIVKELICGESVLPSWKTEKGRYAHSTHYCASL